MQGATLMRQLGRGGGGDAFVADSGDQGDEAEMVGLVVDVAGVFGVEAEIEGENGFAGGGEFLILLNEAGGGMRALGSVGEIAAAGVGPGYVGFAAKPDGFGGDGVDGVQDGGMFVDEVSAVL